MSSGGNGQSSGVFYNPYANRSRGNSLNRSADIGNVQGGHCAQNHVSNIQISDRPREKFEDGAKTERIGKGVKVAKILTGQFQEEPQFEIKIPTTINLDSKQPKLLTEPRSISINSGKNSVEAPPIVDSQQKRAGFFSNFKSIVDSQKNKMMGKTSGLRSSRPELLNSSTLSIQSSRSVNANNQSADNVGNIEKMIDTLSTQRQLTDLKLKGSITNRSGMDTDREGTLTSRREGMGKIISLRDPRGQINLKMNNKLVAGLSNQDLSSRRSNLIFS
jgi:hypothetical protein